MYQIIPFESRYAAQVSRLYHNAVHHIDDMHYSPLHRHAWSQAPRSTYHWNKRLSRSKAWLMLDTEQMLHDQYLCIGFINMETHFFRRGYIDSLYVLPGYQGKGIATRLYQALEAWVQTSTLERLTVDASKLSKDLFLAQGFKLHHNRYQEKCGQVFHMYYLSKSFSAAPKGDNSAN
ncbi:GNAT family N-acetyltransferase [Shewanella sp. AS1]|uniref:GNAT family N-acetyltransferase n=1 Tax=Shewanella sp. AS1 TaxID=2907626 RepID=UPI001F272494|nr:GNAT family N-acetyltransferase [Shewanella sp. AS1]MCE9679219.1 GNAT family N-acetyltransferase [Shewanella sp. AS1]